MTKRVEYVDIAKAAAIFLVVLGHTNDPFVPGQVRTYMDVCYAFHMPLFFFLSGLFICPKENYSWAVWRRFLLKNVLALIVPFMAWGIIYMDNFSYLNIAKIFWGTRGILREIPTVSSLWFLPTFFLARVYCEGVFDLARRLKVSVNLVGALSVPVLFAIGFLLPHNTSHLGGWGNFWGCDIAFVCAGFVMAGYLLKTALAKLSAAPVGVIALACATFSAMFVWGFRTELPLLKVGVDNTMTMCSAVYGPIRWCLFNAFTGTLGFVCAAMLVARIPFKRPFLLFVGANTMGVYLLHKPIVLELKGYFGQWFGIRVVDVWEGLLVAVPAFLISVALLLLVSRFAPKLFGKAGKGVAVSDVLAVVLGEDARVGAIEKRALKDMFECYRRNILADGKVDLEETAMLLRFVTPLAEARGGAYREFRDALVRVREDGVISESESAEIAEKLTALAKGRHCTGGEA